MRKTIIVCALLMLSVLLITGCEAPAEESADVQPPALPGEEPQPEVEDVADGAMQPPAFPEG